MARYKQLGSSKYFRCSRHTCASSHRERYVQVRSQMPGHNKQSLGWLKQVDENVHLRAASPRR